MFIFNIIFFLYILQYLSLNFALFDDRFYYFGLISIFFIFIFFVFPCRCFYSSFRFGVLITLFKNIFPIGKNGVKFADFMFGDVLTSLTRPLSSITLSFCLFSCDNCMMNNDRFYCNRKDLAALCITLAPFIIRFFQCLNRFYYTKQAWPHLANALKYTGGIINTYVSWRYSRGSVSFLVFVIIGVVANSYMLFWDIKMDWRLGEFGSKNFFLRDKLTYPKRFYYMVIVINAILRFTWVYNLISVPIDDELKLFFFSLLEVYRRTQWGILRVENENLHNPEKYRTILDIPSLPNDF